MANRELRGEIGGLVPFRRLLNKVDLHIQLYASIRLCKSRLCAIQNLDLHNVRLQINCL